jgi:formylglycine-generating enzyme required for sulfatase activity
MKAVRPRFSPVARFSIVFSFAVGLVACTCAEEMRLFRLVSPTVTAITSVTTNTLTWTNAAVGGTCTVQTTSVAMQGSWVDYIQVPITNRVMTISLSGQNPSAGLVLISAGSFTMGDRFTEGYADELPAHTVYVSAFYMDQREVTKALWNTVKAWGATNGYGFAGSGQAADHPIQAVSWYDAVRWCNARSQKEGLLPCYYTDAGLTVIYKSGPINPFVNWSATGYRLPTEAEWEKAARGGASGRRFSWSDTDNISHSRANYDAGNAQIYDLSYPAGPHPAFTANSTPYTSPAGYFAPNAYGLYDMGGNVWEWCWDWYQADWYGQKAATQNDTRGPGGPLSYRVQRGGSWGDYAFFSRASYRGYYYPSYGDGNDGFRCVRKP